MLSRSGHRVAVASNGREAMSAVQEQDFDLILMDVQMPIMDGITATKLIRMLPGKVRNIPIIALTANILPEQIENFRRAGMNDHVSKPINISDLTAAIARNSPNVSRTSNPQSVDLASDHSLFDERVFFDLAAILPPDRWKAHLGIFRSAMEQLCEFEGSSDKLMRAAHSMINQSGTFGFKRLSALSRKLENAIENGHAVDDLLAEIRSAVTSIESKIDGLQIQERRLIA